MAGTVNQYQVGTFSSPQDGDALDASVVVANDNSTGGKHNSHDADATIHVQSSTLASRPAASVAQRFWVTTDGLRAYLDSGSAWGELAYLSLAAGGTVSAATTFSAGLTVSSGTTAVQALTATTGVFSSTVSFTGGTFTTSLISTTAFSTPSALSATQFTGFASSQGGAMIMGYGTLYDTSLCNRAGTIILSVGPNNSVTTMAANLVSSYTGGGTNLFATPNATTGQVYILFANTSGSTIWGTESSAGGQLITGSAAYTSVIGANSANALNIVAGGAIAANISTSQVWKMPHYGSGTATFAADGTISSVSDERFKTNVAAYTRTMRDVKHRAVTITHGFVHEQGTFYEPLSKYVGFSAQKLQASVPEVVHSRHELVHDPKTRQPVAIKDTGELSIYDRGIMALLWNTAADHEARLAALEPKS